MKLTAQKGFTLIEIMIVVGILAVLLAVAMNNLMRSRINANDVAAQATLKTFGGACETYAAGNNAAYPTAMADLTQATPRYFAYDPSATARQGFSYTAVFGDGVTTNGYTVTAEPLPRAGNWDYRITPGMLLERSTPGAGDWQVFN